MMWLISFCIGLLSKTMQWWTNHSGFISCVITNIRLLAFAMRWIWKCRYNSTSKILDIMKQIYGLRKNTSLETAYPFLLYDIPIKVRWRNNVLLKKLLVQIRLHLHANVTNQAELDMWTRDYCIQRQKLLSASNEKMTNNWYYQTMFSGLIFISLKTYSLF